MSLAGKVAFVTGGARGLGRGIVDRLAIEGATVIATDIRDAPGFMFTEPLASGTPLPQLLRVDITNAEAVADAVASIVTVFGGIDILVANAGIAIPATSVVDADPDDINRIIGVNIVGTLNTIRAAIPAIRARAGGRVITMSSQTGKDAWAGWGVYSGTKAFVIAVTQALAKEHAADGITANAICPGTMVSDMMVAGFTARAESSHRELRQVIGEYESSSIPVGRMGTAADVGALAAWLASDESSFMTGAALNLTGGEMTFF
ncbi:SDR family NAD(P)-dependent oxidoreductase [Luethyella okanaganae]|uniref:SDR family NAD(P)-dependent oxidoreductase n=1 Tax=Luethyella okanaganae TaxID=69372 RepID=A0ABW1VH13_9MICO